MNQFKRILAMTLAGAMSLSLFPTAAFATEDQADNTAIGIEEILTEAQEALSTQDETATEETADAQAEAVAEPEAVTEEVQAAPQALEEETSAYDGYKAGVTVEADANSPTGYRAVFVYDSKLEDLAALGLAELDTVTLYSDCMKLYSFEDQTLGTIDGTKGKDPADYAEGLYPAGGSGQTRLDVVLTALGDGKYATSIPLSSGAFVYNYTLTDVNAKSVSRLDDPANPAAHNDATGYSDLSSMVYVPYSADTMNHDEWADRSVEIPRTDGRTGSVSNVGYTGADGTTHGLSVYLPYGYDASRAEKYNVLYISHGTGSDVYGEEMRWLNEGAVANIMDNLEADFVVVCMNNQQYAPTAGSPNWDYSKIEEDQFGYIMPYVEANYNVSTEAAGRAYAGLSMGGSTTSNMMMHHVDAFSYYGIWSYANTTGMQDADVQATLQAVEKQPNVMLAYGAWDFGRSAVQSFGDELDKLDWDYSELQVPAAHDWEDWQLTYAWAVKNFFWKNSSSEFDGYEVGVTVEADANSPTGYNAVFIFDEEELANIDYDYYKSQYNKDLTTALDLGNIAQVQIYSNTALLFSYDEQAAGTPLDPANNAHNPDEFVPGLLPAGGDTTSALYGGKKVNYYADMEEFADGRWGVKIPLTSGATDYNIRLIDAEGNTDGTYVYDPANAPMQNTASGVYSRSSMVYVPYNAEKMGTGEYADRSMENPRTDGKTGTLSFDAYTGAEGTERYLGVYLPYGYDATRTEPYNVLYMSHGAQSEKLGSEMRWLNECGVVNIMDNLGADFIVVTMNNVDLGWDQGKIWTEQEKIMSYIEGKYNAGTNPASRAYAGFSMGGMTSSTIYINHADQFGYVGIWSYANLNGLKALSDEEKAALAAQDTKISIGAGDWDYLLSFTDQFAEVLDEMGVSYDYLTVPGSHDWRTWQAMFADATQNFFFKAENTEYDGYNAGVTVEADANSPTGYTAVFVYDSKLEDLAALGLSELESVTLYSDCMMLFNYDEQKAGVGIDAANAHTPDEFTKGMYPAGGNGATTYYAKMEKLADGRWGVKVPLTNGATVYNFTLTDVNGTSKSRLDDPANPAAVNTATGVSDLSSLVYVPYDAEKMGTGNWVDRSVELPVTDSAAKGTVQTIGYTGTAGENRGLAVYLPAGYDANRAEAYNVLYLSHGASGDKLGNELRWMYEGAVANIMDNLKADFVVVTMNNGDTGWDQDKIWAEQELIFKHIEANYNVRSDKEGRAFAGLSMGGITTTNMYANHSEAYSYYGVWSASTPDVVSNLTDEQKADLVAGNNHLMLAAGDWDFGLSSVNKLGETLTDLGVTYDYVTVPAAHDWETWQLLYAYATENFFWKDVPAVKDGLTMDADGVWRLYKDGKVETGYTGLAYYDGNWYFVKNGEVHFDYTGLVPFGEDWFYCQSSVLQWGYNGFAQYGDTWYYCNNSKVDFGYTGLGLYDGIWYYCENGIQNTGYTGLAQYGDGWYYVANGVLGFDYFGLVNYGDGWYYCQNSIFAADYTGMVLHGNAAFYVEKGMVNFDYTGLVPYGGILYYVAGGILDWTFNGTVSYQGKTYTVVNGIAQ